MTALESAETGDTPTMLTIMIDVKIKTKVLLSFIRLSPQLAEMNFPLLLRASAGFIISTCHLRFLTEMIVNQESCDSDSVASMNLYASSV
jgi:hypothetical protein